MSKEKSLAEVFQKKSTSAVIVLAAVFVLALVVGFGAGTLFQRSNIGKLQARIAYLETAFGTAPIDESVLEEMEGRLQGLEYGDTNRLTERLMAIQAKVEELEQVAIEQGAPPIVDATSLSDVRGGQVAVVGIVTRISKNRNNHMFVELDGGSATGIWWRCPYDPDDLGIEEGDAVVIVGQADEYEGQPQVIFNSLDAIITWTESP